MPYHKETLLGSFITTLALVTISVTHLSAQPEMKLSVAVNDFTVSNMNPQEAILITDRIRL